MLLTDHLSKFSLLPVNQSAYRDNHSNETALLSLFDDLLRADQEDASALVFLNLSAAFDFFQRVLIMLERQNTVRPCRCLRVFRRLSFV